MRIKEQETRLILQEHDDDDEKFYNNLCTLVGQIKDLILSTCSVQLQRCDIEDSCSLKSIPIVQSTRDSIPAEHFNNLVGR